MKTIFKFPIQVTDDQDIEMPSGAKIICVQMQGGEPHIWAEVDSNAPKVKKKIRVFGAGHPMTDDFLQYIGTFQMMEGRLVFHSYEAV